MIRKRRKRGRRLYFEFEVNLGRMCPEFRVFEGHGVHKQVESGVGWMTWKGEYR